MSSISMPEFMVSLFVMVGTVAAAIAACMSSIEAQKNSEITRKMLELQQEKEVNDVKPCLLILEKDVEIEFRKEEINPIHTYNWDTKEYTLTDKPFSEKVNIDIVNIGKGFAKDVTCYFEVNNLPECLEQLSHKDKNSWYELINIGCCINNKKEVLAVDFYIKTQTRDYASSNEYYIKSSIPQRFSIINNGINQEKYKLNLPSAFIVYINYLISTLSLSIADYLPKKYPSISMIINYKDIDDREYEERFNIFITKFNKGTKENGSLSYGRLRLESRKITN
ncbi:hypothetical protein ACQKNC_15965 [Lysinibacillus sp. NPDC094177]|uniref:hypothetical protein n=1 Tax=Lysinibacillus sp. NPDC094177 TaxID=3390580 RepID=UPI003D087488